MVAQYHRPDCLAVLGGGSCCAYLSARTGTCVHAPDRTYDTFLHPFLGVGYHVGNLD